jgi:hypothetical protein
MKSLIRFNILNKFVNGGYCFVMIGGIANGYCGSQFLKSGLALPDEIIAYQFASTLQVCEFLGKDVQSHSWASARSFTIEPRAPTLQKAKEITFSGVFCYLSSRFSRFPISVESKQGSDDGSARATAQKHNGVVDGCAYHIWDGVVVGGAGGIAGALVMNCIFQMKRKRKKMQ